MTRSEVADAIDDATKPLRERFDALEKAHASDAAAKAKRESLLTEMLAGYLDESEPPAARPPMPPRGERDPLATVCGSRACDRLFSAPPTVQVGDVLTCPRCSAQTVVVDTGRAPGTVEYLRTRAVTAGETALRAASPEVDGSEVRDGD